MFFYYEAGICGLSLFIKLIVCHYYRRLIKDSGNMAQAETRVIKNVKVLFEGEYRRFGNINNIDMFVHKYLFGIRMLGVKLSSWEGAGMLNVFACAALGGAAAFRAFTNGYDDEYVIIRIMGGFIAGFLIILIDLLANTQAKQEHLRVNVCSYLENELKPLLEGHAVEGGEKLPVLSGDIDEGIRELFNLISEGGEIMDSKPSDAETGRRKTSSPKMKDTKPADGEVYKNDTEDKILRDVIEEYFA